MRIGYLDCFSGVAGDMWVGALLDLGLPLARLEAAVRTLALPGVSLRAERVLRCGITGTHFTVVLGGAGETGVKFQPVSPLRAPASAAATSHSHRRLADVRAILARADLPAPVRAQCDAVFVAIAAAESLQHASSADEVHFHEVGAEDTITDVVCACLGTHLLGLDRLYASAVAVGSGTVQCAHGLLPVPAPGTLELLRGMPVRQGGLVGERTTPTGAALLKVLVHEFEPQFTWIPGDRGHGAGTRDDPLVPNLLRLTVGELRAPGSKSQLLEIACNLDTATGEHLGFLLDELLARGATDAFATPVHMKKGRPGFLLTVLCDDARADLLTTFLLEDSTSLGLRSHRVQRAVLERWQETRSTPFGDVRFKVARLPSGALLARPEDDELRRLCTAHTLSRAEVLRRLLG